MRHQRPPKYSPAPQTTNGTAALSKTRFTALARINLCSITSLTIKKAAHRLLFLITQTITGHSAALEPRFLIQIRLRRGLLNRITSGFPLRKGSAFHFRTNARIISHFDSSTVFTIVVHLRRITECGFVGKSRERNNENIRADATTITFNFISIPFDHVSFRQSKGSAIGPFDSAV